VTNSGGVPLETKAKEVSKIVKYEIDPKKLIVAHSPMKKVAKLYKDKRVMLIGRNVEHCANIARQFGLSNFIHSSEFEVEKPNLSSKSDEKIHAIFILKTPIDWEENLQIISEMVYTGGDLSSIPKEAQIPQKVPIYAANPDVIYQSSFPIPRYTVGAFLLCLKTLYKELAVTELEIQEFGKPHPVTYEFAEKILRKQANILGYSGIQTFYAIGDNPKSDVRGANNRENWYSILTRTGIFVGKENDEDFPAKFVAEDVNEAVDFLLSKEGIPNLI